MSSLYEIEIAIQLGWAYYTQQINAVRLKMVGGCFTCTSRELTCLGAILLSLEYDVETENISPLTAKTLDALAVMLSGFTGLFTADPTVTDSGISIQVIESVAQTPVVFPGDGISSYTFPELIGRNVLTVYRGTGTVLRARSSFPDNEYVQFDPLTGEITVSYPFSDGESLWAEYKITT